MIRAKLVAALAAAGLAASTMVAVAADPKGAAIAEESKFDLTFGVTFTTHYMSRGMVIESLAIQPYAEATYDMFYFGIWGSNIPGGAEIDLSVGIRPEIGKFAFDFGYGHYIYTEGTPDNGDLYALVEFAATEKLTLGAGIYYDPYNDITFIEGTSAIALPHNLEWSSAIGYQFDPVNGDYPTWNTGLTWQATDFMNIDLRYHDADGAPSKFVASLTFETSLSAIRGNGK